MFRKINKFDKIMLLFSVPAVIGVFIIAVWHFSDTRSLPAWLIYGVLLYAILCAICLFIEKIWTNRKTEEQEEHKSFDDEQ